MKRIIPKRFAPSPTIYNETKEGYPQERRHHEQTRTIIINNNYYYNKTKNNMKLENCTFNGPVNTVEGTQYVGDTIAREFADRTKHANHGNITDIIKTSLETVVKMKAPDGGQLIAHATQLEAVRCVANECLGIHLSKKTFATTIESMNLEGMPSANIYTAILAVDDKYASTHIDEWINNRKLTEQKPFTQMHSVAMAFKQVLQRNMDEEEVNS